MSHDGSTDRHGAAHPALSRSDYRLVLRDQALVLSRGFRDRLFRCLRITDLDVLDLAQELEAFALLVDGPVLAGRQGATVEADFT
jgi:hypothetical protein